MGFDVEGARKAGYSEPEIMDHLAKQSNFDVAGAKKAGYSDAEILQHLSTVSLEPAARGTVGAPEAAIDERPRRKGVLKNQPEIDIGPTPTMAELGQQWRDIAVGAPQGLITAIPGLPGDIESLFHKDTVLPTSSDIADYMFGPVASPYEAGGRALGGAVTGFATPGIAARIGTAKQAVAAANYPKTARALGAAQMAVDPLTPLLSGTVTVGGKAYNALRDAANYVLAPEAAAANRLAAMTNDPAAALQAMQTTQNMLTSGGPVSVSERLAAGNVAEPRVAAAQEALAEGVTAAQMQQAQQARIAAIQSNLQQVEQQLSNTAATLTPAAAAQLSEVRNSLLRSLAAEQTRLEAAGGQIAGQIPNVGQRAPGERLTDIAITGRVETGTQVTSPAYREAYRLAGDEPITVDAALEAARRIQAAPGAVTDTSTVPQSISSLREFEPPMQPGPFTELAPGQGFSGAPVRPPATMTLQEFGDIRESLVRDLNNARKSPSLDAPTRARHLENVLDQMDAALAASNVSPEAREAYQAARRLYRTEVVEPFKTGETARLLQTGMGNRQALLPDNAVNAFLNNETSAQQFVTTFGNNPAAARAMGEGIGDLFRSKVIDPVTGFVDQTAAAKFLADNGRQLNILENAGVNVRGQLTQIRDAAATNAAQREALAEAHRRLGGTGDAKALVNDALKSPTDMDFMRRRLSPDAREALGAEVKNRALDAIKNGDPETAIKYLADNKKTIEMAIGRNGKAEHAAMVDLAKTQQQLLKTKDALPNTGLYDPAVLASKFPPSQLTDLRTATEEIARMKQMSDVAQAGRGARVTPEPAAWNNIISTNPLVWAKTIAAKMGKNWADQRITSEAFRVMYENPERFTAALDAAMKQKQRGAAAQTAARTVSNSLLTRPIISSTNALAPQEAQ
jgi:hypothetical protein